MAKKHWLIGAGVVIAGVGAALVAIDQMIGLARFFKGQTEYHTMQGPVAVVSGNAPKYGFLGIDFESEAANPLSIHDVLAGGAGAQAGLQPGDVILSIGSAQQPDISAIHRVLASTVPGDSMSLLISRDGKEKQVTVRLMSFVDMAILKQRQRRAATAP